MTPRQLCNSLLHKFLTRSAHRYVVLESSPTLLIYQRARAAYDARSWHTALA